jgi:hypothetical protein
MPKTARRDPDAGGGAEGVMLRPIGGSLPPLWPGGKVYPARTAREPHRSTLDQDRGYYGETPMGLRRYERAPRDAVPPIPPKTAKNRFQR